MSLSSNVKTNIKNKNIINKNNKTIIQDARLNIPINNPNLSFSSSQKNLNSLNNDGWTQVNKRNYSSFSEPNSPTKIINRNKKLLISKNRFEVLSQTESIKVDKITQNPDSNVNNIERTPNGKKVHIHLHL